MKDARWCSMAAAEVAAGSCRPEGSSRVVLGAEAAAAMLLGGGVQLQHQQDQQQQAW